MSIEHQIRAFAGVFILAGLSLGLWVSRTWLFLVLFVGLNLLQSAWTGFCPLEKLLERLEKKA
jgi:Inner membrane protein YgaP-like, transmembrane domain